MNTPLRRLSLVALLLFAALFVSTTWVQYVQAGTLNADSRNSRTLIDALSRERGQITAGRTVLVTSQPVDDVFKFQRRYEQPDIYAPVTGFYSLAYGATGIEGAETQVLSGTSDAQFYRRLSDIVSGREPKGAGVELTINPRAQQAAWDALGDQRGAVVALDPKTGDILAMVSKPSYDPNRLATHDRKAAKAAWEELNADKARPMVNRAISGNLYPPGSVFKVVTATAAIESGQYNENSILPGPAVLDLPLTSRGLPNSGGAPCGNGQVSLTNAMRTSCNTAFGYLGMQLGGDALRTQAEKFGFGQELSVPLRVTPSNIPAELNAPQEAQTGVGQYETRVTPLEMAMVAAAVGNDGDLMKPNLVRKVTADNLDVLEQPSPQSMGRPMSKETAAQLTRMMETVVTNGTGTRAAIPGVPVAGKTGTAQHLRGAAPHAWFISFAPADDPKVAVAVVVESGGAAGDEASGGRTAAPIARATMEAVLQG